MISTGLPPASAGDPDAQTSPIVLLVEDEIIIRMDIGDQLREAGWTVYEAASGDEAIRILKSPIIVDLVLTDVRMPGTADGVEVASVARGERPTVKVAIMSGHHRPTFDEMQLFDCFLTKPLRHDFMQELQKLVAGSGRQAAR
jgi:CheY-like chemotaxis protein